MAAVEAWKPQASGTPSLQGAAPTARQLQGGPRGEQPAAEGGGVLRSEEVWPDGAWPEGKGGAERPEAPPTSASVRRPRRQPRVFGGFPGGRWLRMRPPRQRLLSGRGPRNSQEPVLPAPSHQTPPVFLQPRPLQGPVPRPSQAPAPPPAGTSAPPLSGPSPAPAGTPAPPLAGPAALLPTEIRALQSQGPKPGPLQRPVPNPSQGSKPRRDPCLFPSRALPAPSFAAPSCLGLHCPPNSASLAPAAPPPAGPAPRKAPSLAAILAPPPSGLTHRSVHGPQDSALEASLAPPPKPPLPRPPLAAWVPPRPRSSGVIGPLSPQ
ncbi:basic proline-rich protein-like [Equus caballus]|uniref:basic proline-rich protein-like n=1 Tax=Equus caballus TaxID=9796 RepID=UPI0038B3341B